MFKNTPLVLVFVLYAPFQVLYFYIFRSNGYIRTIYHIKGCFVMMVLLASNIASESCSKSGNMLLIRRQGCIPKRVILFRCSGQCTSYVRPSSENPSQLERFCMCCNADETKLVPSYISCPFSPGFKRIRLTLNVALSCRCRPCIQTPDVTPMEREHGVWGSMKRSSNNVRGEFKIDNSNKYSDRTLQQLINLGKPFIHIAEPGFNITIKEIG